MKREKTAIELGKAARAIRQRDNKNAVLKAVATNAEGVDEELDSQATMVPAMAASNRERQQQCLGTPPTEPAFVADFGYLADTAAALEVINGTYVAPDGMRTPRYDEDVGFYSCERPSQLPCGRGRKARCMEETTRKYCRRAVISGLFPL